MLGLWHHMGNTKRDTLPRVLPTDEPVDAVLYLYEIQLSGLVQRGGLGQHLMGLVEVLAMRLHLPRVLLTVFKVNRAATFFYLGKLK
jgi:hypothetical protein